MKGKIKILFAIAAISFVQGLQISISPVLGAIGDHFSDVDVSLIQMIITIPAFISMIFSLIGGWLVVKISKKKLLLLACALAGIAGLLPLAADSFALLFASRIIYGISLGWCVSLNAAVVSEFFEGNLRVRAMGIQAACVGGGMLILSALSGFLGAADFRLSYYVNAVAFICMLVIFFCLPDTGCATTQKGDKIRPNKKVLGICAFVFFEMMFLITFSTNISMHVEESFSGGSSISGVLTGVFSGSQIVVGLVLGAITRLTKKYVLPTAMFCYSVGAILLVVFPHSVPMLIVASLFCGFSQGIYIPSGFVDVSNAVPPAAVAMASAFFNAFACIGQTVSPYVTNSVSTLIFGERTTSGVFLVAALGMMLSGIALMIVKRKSKN